MLVVAVYRDPLFVRRNFGGRDLLAYNLPAESVIHDAYSRGRLPVWNSAISGGRPLLANPNAGALYPVRMLASLVPFPLAMRLFPVLHWFLGGLGVLLLARTIGGSVASAWIAAVTFAFSGVSVSEVFFPHIQPGMTLLPWILWLVARPTAGAARRIVPLACVLGLDLLAADVFTIGVALLCVFVWILTEVPESEQKRRAAECGAALALAGLLAVPQIVASALWIPHTNRAVLGMKLGDALLYSISPYRLIEFLVPYPFGRTWSLEYSAVWGKSVFHGKTLGLFASLYCGAFALVAVVWTWRRRAASVRFSKLLLAFGLAASVLPSLIPLSWANVASPLPLRNPEKLAVTIVLALALLSAVAFDRMRAERLGVSRGMVVVGGLLAVVAVAAAWQRSAAGELALRLTRADPRFLPAARATLPPALAEAGLFWMATLVAIDAARRPGRASQWAGLLLLTAVPIAADRRIARSYREDEVFAPTAFARMQARRDPEGRFRALGESLYRPASALWEAQAGSDLALDFERRNWFEHTQALWGRGTVFNDDFDSGDFARVQSLRRISGMAAGYRDSGDFFGAFSLRWGIRFRDEPSLAGFRRIGGDALQDWDENPSSFPDVRLVTRWRETRGALPALAAINRLAPGEIVVESEADARGSAREGTVRVLERSPERLRLELDSPDPTWLFVLRAYWPYRTILLDGRETDAVPAQLAMCAVRIPAGRHRLEWIERVPGGEASRWGSVLSAAVLAGIVIAGKRRTA